MNVHHRIYHAINRLPSSLRSKALKAYSDPRNYKTVGLWFAAIVAALVSVAYAKIFRMAEEGFRHVLSANPYAFFVISPILFLLAWWIVRRYAPEAAGSGIPQIMAANEMGYEGDTRPKVDKLLSMRTALIKVISSLLCVSGGGAIGREGPTLQICASIFHLFGKQVRRIVPDTSEHMWVVAGAASGLASAFNTPLGGIVYAIEELGLVHFQKVRTALLGGVIVSGLVAQLFLGSYLYLGLPEIAKFSYAMFPVAVLNGVITGLMGAIFGKLLLFFLNKRLAVKRVWHLAAITVVCGIVAAGLSYTDQRSSGTGVDVITGLLFHKHEADAPLIAFRYFGTMVAYLSGAAGGIFSPSLAIGATIGSYLANIFASEHANLMILLGMIGFLTGVTRTPFTSFILVLEMTDRHSAIFPMMVTALISLWVSRLIDDRSFYEHVKEKYSSPSP